ncbi:uncharacterized protein JCM6883_003538 [Sporobolomyces salmoneus]|uniref:uncharacterized protein n=1 Tax=Sporobolomyces salmoneus TaxID=183962 RepID=UPI00317965E9
MSLPTPATPLDSILSLHDFEISAQATLKPKSWAYYESSADDGQTYRRSKEIWREIRFRPRVMRDVSGEVDLRTDFFGFESEMPIMISPAAMGKLAHKDGELCIVKGAGRLGIPYATSNHASTSHLDMSLSALPSQTLFFQLYLHKERWRSAQQISEAIQQGYKALIVTVDTPFPGKRELDERTGLDDWSIGLANQGEKPGAKVSAIAQTSAVIDASLSWVDLPWLKEVSKGLPILIKGIHTFEDALKAYELGARGIILSNHGGRQVNTANTSLEALLELRRHTPHLLSNPNRFFVILDGGIRRGTDVLKALCLGAHAVSTARPFMFALPYGEDGIEKCGEILREEIVRGMKLLGVRSVKELGEKFVNARGLERLVFGESRL